MISEITGELLDVREDHVQIKLGPIVCELLVPAVDVIELEAHRGEEVTLYTIFELQGEASGGSITPRLIGFLRKEDKRFFEKFTTVKGIGTKTALRALTVPVGEIAQAIESRDARFLIQLDGIGKRTAELVIAELAGKVQEFAAPMTATMRAGGVRGGSVRSQLEEDAIAALMQLGERRLDAEHLLDRARQANAKAVETQDLVREMLRLRTVRA